MRVSLIAAATAAGVIGADGRLPWHLPRDFKYFRERTLGKPVLMGRRTWDSIGRPLPDRRNLVLSRNSAFDAPGAVVVGSVAAAFEAAGDADELMVIGGGEIYRLFMPLASRVYLTRVDAEIDGDARFPELDPGEWRLVSAEPQPADERHAYSYEFRVYDRR